MKRYEKRPRRLGGLLFIAALSVLAGCQQYEVRVEVAADGSGRREVALEAETPKAWPERPSAGDYLRLHHISPETGWTLPEGFDAAADSVSGMVFTREVFPDGFADWSRTSGDIHIRGRLPGGPAGGPMRRSVEFGNEVKVAPVALEGETLIEYREQFQWHGLRHLIAENYADRFIAGLTGAYPALTSPDIQRIRGLVEGLVQVALEFQSGDEPERLEEALTRALRVHAFEVVRGRIADADAARVGELARTLVQDSEEDLDRFIAQVYPGVHIGWQTRVELSVTMPGDIVDTNADRIEGRTASWEIDSGEAITGPVTAYVRSRRGPE